MKERKAFVVAVATALAVVVWYVALFGPQRAERRRLAERTATAEQQEPELRSTLGRLRRLAGQQPERQAQLAHLTRLVPPHADVAGFILAANDAAVRSGIDWVSVTPGTPATGVAGAPSSINVGIEVKGGFFTVLDYLQRLERLDRLLVVDSVQFTIGGQAAGAPLLSAVLTSRIFTSAVVAPAPGTAPSDTVAAPAVPSNPEGG